VVPDEMKLSELILYVADKLLPDPKGGATKVNKILFAAEFAHMRTHGHPITGVEYQRLERGPAPRRLVPIRDALMARGDLDLVRDRYMGYGLDRLVPKRPARTELFTQDELALVDAAIDELWESTADEASRQSHRETGWRMVGDRETIPYESAYLAPKFEVTESMRQHAASLAERFQ
jgi:hypothetical protein